MQVSVSQKDLLVQLRAKAVTPSPGKATRSKQHLRSSSAMDSPPATKDRAKLPAITPTKASSPSPSKKHRGGKHQKGGGPDPQGSDEVDNANGVLEGGSVLSLLTLHCANERNRLAVRAVHDQVYEKARSSVLERRRDNSGPELNAVLRKFLGHYKDNPKWAQQRGGKGIPTVVVPTIEEAIIMLGEEKNHSAVKGDVEFTEHMAKQMRWLIGELGSAKEHAETWEEQYRLLLIKFSGTEEAVIKAVDKQEAAEEYARQINATLHTERTTYQEKIRALNSQVDVLRDKVCTLLEQAAASPASIGSPSPTVGGPSSSPVGNLQRKRRGSRALTNALDASFDGGDGASTTPQTGESDEKGLGFEQKEEYLRQIVHHKQVADEAVRELSNVENQFDLAKRETQKQRHAVTRAEAARESEVGSLKKLLCETRDGNLSAVSKLESRCAEAEAQSKSLELTVSDVQLQLQDSVARLISLQKVMVQGPSMQMLLKTSLEKDQADEVVEGLGAFTEVVSDFAGKFNSVKPKDTHAMLKEAVTENAKKKLEAAAASGKESPQEGQLDTAEKDPEKKEVKLPSMKAFNRAGNKKDTISRWTQVEVGDVEEEEEEEEEEEDEEVEVIPPPPPPVIAAVAPPPPLTPLAAISAVDERMDEKSSAQSTSVVETEMSLSPAGVTLEASMPRSTPGTTPSHAALGAKPDGLPVPGSDTTSSLGQPSLVPSKNPSTLGDVSPSSQSNKRVIITLDDEMEDSLPGNTRGASPSNRKPSKKMSKTGGTSKRPKGTGGDENASSNGPSLKKRGSTSIKRSDTALIKFDNTSNFSEDPGGASTSLRQSRSQVIAMREVVMDNTDQDFKMQQLEQAMVDQGREKKEEGSRLQDQLLGMTAKADFLEEERAALQEANYKLTVQVKDLDKTLTQERKNLLSANDRFQKIFLDGARLQEQADQDQSALREDLKAAQEKAGDLQKDLTAALRSDERVYLCNRERLLLENVERVMRCLSSAQNSTVCQVCLDPFVHPITLFPCGHVICEYCFYSSNLDRNIEIMPAARHMIQQRDALVEMARIQDTREKHLSAKGSPNSSTRGPPDSSVSFSGQGLAVTATFTAQMQAAKRVKMLTTSVVRVPTGRPMWCDECQKQHVTSFLPSRRIDEVCEKISYVMGIANEVKYLSAARLVEVQSTLSSVDTLNKVTENFKSKTVDGRPISDEDGQEAVGVEPVMDFCVGDTSGQKVASTEQPGGILSPIAFGSSSSDDGEDE